MLPASKNSTTLVVEVPTHVKDAAAAMEKWLLALWESGAKSGPALWRDRATVSLEYVGDADGVRYQVWFRDQVLLDASKSLLPSLFTGIDVAPREAEPLSTG